MTCKNFRAFPAILFGASLAVASLVPSGPALAVVPVTIDSDPGALANTLTIIANGIENAATEAESVLNSQVAIVKALLNHSGQATVNSNAQTTAMSNIADVKDIRDTQRAIQNTQVRSFQDATTGPSACNVITGNLGGQSLDPEVRILVSGMSRAHVAWGNGETVDGKPTAATAGPNIADRKTNSLHCTYGNTQDVFNGACTTAAPLAMVNRDMTIDTITANTVMSKEDYDAGMLFLARVMPRTFGGLPAGVGKTEAGQALIARRNASLARESIAHNTLDFIFANHAASPSGSQQSVNGVTTQQSVNGKVTSPGGLTTGSTTPQTGVRIIDWAEATAAQTLGYAPSNNFPNGVSKDAWHELRAKGWFLNPEWVAAVNADPVQATKESAVILSYIALQNWESYKLQEKEAATLAGILSIMEEDKRSRM